jgi:Tfp pilus assembly protein PilN
MTIPNTSGSVETTQVMRLPSVNLIPQEIAEANKFRRVQFALGASLVAAAGVVGLLSFQASHDVSSAKDRLAAAQQETTTLQGQRAALQSVQDVFNQLSARQTMLSTAMAPEIRWSYYLEDLSLRIPNNVWLTNVNATETGASQSATPATAAASGIGNIQFSGVAFSHDDVATWLDVLAKEKGWASPYFSNSTEGLIGSHKVVNFSSSVVITGAARSGRYNSASEN